MTSSTSNIDAPSASAQFPPTTVGPIRRVRTQKRRQGYGLFYSDDESSGDEVIRSAQTYATTAKTVRYTDAPRSAVIAAGYIPESELSSANGSGVKSLTIERRIYSKEELYGKQGPSSNTHALREATPRKSPETPARFSTLTSVSRPRSSRKSPYNTTPVARRLRDMNKDLGSELEDAYIDRPVSPISTSANNKYIMRGGLVTPPARGSSVIDRFELQTPPPPPPPRTPARQEDVETPTPNGKTTWGQWADMIKGIISRTPVSKPAQLVRELDVEIVPALPADTNGSPTESPRPSTPPPPDNQEEEENLWPGSYRKTPVKVTTPKNPEPINAALALEYQPKNPSRRASARSFGDIFNQPGRYRPRPSPTTRRRMTMSMSVGNHDRSQSVVGPSLQSDLTEAFIKSAIPSNPAGYKRARLSLNQGALSEEEKKKIAEERLLELEKNKRDRKVWAMEDRYERRFLLASLGQSWEEEEEARGDSDTEDDNAANDVPEAKSKGKGGGQEPLKEKSPEAETEPTVPSLQKPFSPVSKPSSFLFGGGAYNASSAPAPPVIEVPVPLSSPRAASPTPNGTSPPSSTSDKEVTSTSPVPPATPTLSHAQLPSPIVPTGPALLPPPPSPSLVSPQKGTTGLGFGDPALKARSRAEKFKPLVPSGLRESTAAQSDSPPRVKPATTNHQFTSPMKTPRKSLSPTAERKVTSPLKDGKKQAMLKVSYDPEIYQMFLEALNSAGDSKGGDEIVRLELEKVWRAPREDEVAGWYNMFVSAAAERTALSASTL